MLKQLRAIELMNVPVRKILRWVHSVFTKFPFLLHRWPVSGTVSLTFNGHSFRYYGKCDDVILTNLYYNLPYAEEFDLKLFMNLAQEVKTVVDIGANTGLYSVLTAKANPDAKIYSFEPHPANANRLAHNLKINEANAEILPMAVSDVLGTIQFTIPDDNRIVDVASVSPEFARTMYPHLRWKEIDVPVITLDIFRAERNNKIDLLKCDVEGHEVAVFKGADKTLREDKPLILLECFVDHDRQSFFNEILSKYEYYVYVVLPTGLFYLKEGFVPGGGLNFLLTPKRPERVFLNAKEVSTIRQQLV